MKKNYASFLAAGLLASASASAQFVQVLDEGGNQVNGTTVYADCSADDAVKEVDFTTVSTTDQFVRMRRYETSVLSGTGNYFCWDICWLSVLAGVHPVWESNGAQHLGANVPFTGAHAYYEPNHIPGTSTFRYVWYSSSDENDSTWVDLVFNAQPVGITENAALVRGFEAFPNPSNNSDVTLTYDLATAPAGTQLVLYNMLGERKLVRALGAAQGRVILHNDDLSAGVWFATIESDGHAVATRRIVVTR